MATYLAIDDALLAEALKEGSLETVRHGYAAYKIPIDKITVL